MGSYATHKDMFNLSPAAQYDAVSIALASPDTIRKWSHGEVKNPETINYRTYRPERDGLFCERIFGPQKDWECSCGKFKRIKHKGIICDRCGVEVTQSRVRRERMGHIELAVPVSHIWFFKCNPSRIGSLLDLSATVLERVLYYEDYLVTDPGETPLKEYQLLTEPEYNDAVAKYGPEAFEAGMGAEVIRTCLRRLDLEEMRAKLEEELINTRSKQTRKKITKRMKIIEGFRQSGAKPEWMILEVLPVIPPELRPLVPLEGGRFATSDLNDLYRRVINRNNRLVNLLSLKTPDVIIRNEKRMLQEAVDAVFDNGRHGRPVAGAGGRALKSLSDMLKGKTGRFRQNLLGKRVDYSGRSVIVVGPHLKLHQCGLPKKMALTLFEPFIIRRLKELGLCHTVRTAKKMIEQQKPEVWDILEEVTRGKTVMLNRAPTLHRLSIQSFEPVLIEGEAIRLHPMVCTPFNADFDGDQMAVHVPLSVEAQLESRLLMLSTNSIFSPASGDSNKTPTQDIALGCYFLTAPSQADKNANKPLGKGVKPNPETDRLPLFGSTDELMLAFNDGAVKVHDRIWFRNPDFGIPGRKNGDAEQKVIVTTVGRVIFNEIWPDEMGFWNDKVTKSTLGKLILACHQVVGHNRTIEMLDELKALGFEWACQSGASMGIKDMISPADKEKIIDASEKEVLKVQKQFNQGVITDTERKGKITDIWSSATDRIADSLYKTIEQNISPENKNPSDINPIYMMADSKARGSRTQIRQLAGMRGLMAKPNGEIIETPITASFREGLSVLEYFISSHGARKGLADTALKTADAGYMTRKLVDVAQDVIITQQDCNTTTGIEVEAVVEGTEVKLSLAKRIIGRTSVHEIVHPRTGEVLVEANEEIDEAKAKLIEDAEIEKVMIRSGLTCSCKHGMCAKCYGRDLSTGKTVEIGTAVGIIAAQSIGEPGTQLTMRTFHVGGTASTVTEVSDITLKRGGTVRYSGLRTVRTEAGEIIVLNRNGNLILVDDAGAEIETYPIQMGSTLYVEDNGKADAGMKIAEWDPHAVPIIADVDGIVVEEDFEEGITVKTEIDGTTGARKRLVLDARSSNLYPRLVVKKLPEGKKIDIASLDLSKLETLGIFSIPAGANVLVEDGEVVMAGEALARMPRGENKTHDITGGLPRVAELFEARTPKDVAEIAEIDGVVDFGDNERGKRVLIITDKATEMTRKYLIPMAKQILVVKGDRVKRGQQLTEGTVSPQKILAACGALELSRYLVNEVQQVYRLQEVQINDKHIEIIIRQMLRKVSIVNPHDTDFLYGEQVSQNVFNEVNERVKESGSKGAECVPALLGITKASLETDSFISAASFQDTTRVLTEASTLGRVDELRGFKENVILGHLIPGGTGFPMHRYVKLVTLGTPISQDEMDKVYGKKDENGILTDSIEIPAEELETDADSLADLTWVNAQGQEIEQDQEEAGMPDMMDFEEGEF
ncbi:MAG: DNA-directed RNA polymerase subunit beta' [Kiritimatiellae bacterium]|nr:DNA-directed RNA polymerase subunit beta' [Kiritimatiellia bacterium]